MRVTSMVVLGGLLGVIAAASACTGETGTGTPTGTGTTSTGTGGAGGTQK